MTGFDRLDWGGYLAFQALPTALVSEIGQALSGAMGRRRQPALHAQARTVFAAVRPDWARTDAELDRAVDRLWACVGRGAAEMAIAPRILRQRKVTFDDPAPLDFALSSGRPVIGLYLHLGNWELSAMEVARRAAGRAAAVYSPPPQKALAAIASRIRRHVPGILFPSSPRVWRQVLMHLEKPGGMLLMSADASYGGVHAPSLGRPVRTDGNLGKAARLALRTGAIIVPFYNERLPAQRFVTHVLPTQSFDGSPSDPDAVRAAVVRLDEAFQQPVVTLLDQWYAAFFCRGLPCAASHPMGLTGALNP